MQVVAHAAVTLLLSWLSQIGACTGKQLQLTFRASDAIDNCSLFCAEIGLKTIEALEADLLMLFWPADRHFLIYRDRI